MATSTSTAQGIRSLNPRYSGGGEGAHGPRSSFDADVPPGVDPDSQWRHANSTGFRRTGATTAERAGAVPGYTPGYGRSSNQNTSGGLTPKSEWDSLFTPRLAGQVQQRNAADAFSMVPGMGTAMDMAKNATQLPPAANPPASVAPPAPAPLPMPPSPGTMDQMPAPASPVIGTIGGRPLEQNVGSTGNVQRQVTGLPTGQTASASFVKGQNSPQNLATRTRKPVDPLAT